MSIAVENALQELSKELLPLVREGLVSVDYNKYDKLNITFISTIKSIWTFTGSDAYFDKDAMIHYIPSIAGYTDKYQFSRYTKLHTFANKVLKRVEKCIENSIYSKSYV